MLIWLLVMMAALWWVLEQWSVTIMAWHSVCGFYLPRTGSFVVVGGELLTIREALYLVQQLGLSLDCMETDSTVAFKAINSNASFNVSVAHSCTCFTIQSCYGRCLLIIFLWFQIYIYIFVK
ncbi:hypothetical protein Ddye_013907 [Dipteronia dyeriana]|uniref:Secreted protein n=1 Tax=Dipteronia dyeriana TaxID=168575 RepID=A0AAD9X7C9_9ROSI|nr:hypothetical protein Ddye_013907 [Dipteronia dyeriana]